VVSTVAERLGDEDWIKIDWPGKRCGHVQQQVNHISAGGYLAVSVAVIIFMLGLISEQIAFIRMERRGAPIDGEIRINDCYCGFECRTGQFASVR
jgi:hypothetical protein